jgi:hypothetical protein
VSRTAHHISRSHWNVKTLEVERWRVPWEQEFRASWNEVGHIQYDLRFYAGCKRIPEMTRHSVTKRNWLGHGGSSAVRGYARKFWGRQRNEERMYALDIRKTAQAGGDLEEIPEPDGRTRHSAIWDAW